MVCGKCWKKVSGGVVDGDHDHPDYRCGLQHDVLLCSNAKLSELNAGFTCAPLHCYSWLACVRYGGLWKNLHKADKLPDSLHEGDIAADSLNNLETKESNKDVPANLTG